MSKELDLDSIELRNLGGEDGSTRYYINQDVADLISEVRRLREKDFITGRTFFDFIPKSDEPVKQVLIPIVWKDEK